MSSGYLELFIEQGESFTANISLIGLNDAPYPLQNCATKCDIRKSYWSENITSSFNTSINIETSEVVMSMNANTSQDISPGRYVYDLFLTESDTGSRSKVLEGILFVEPSATRI